MNNADLLKIADEFGTPVYVYDAESIKTQYEKLTSSFSENTKFFYSAGNIPAHFFRPKQTKSVPETSRMRTK